MGHTATTNRQNENGAGGPGRTQLRAARAVSVLVPAAVGAASAYAFVGALPMPRGPAVVPWALGLVVTTSTIPPRRSPSC